MVGGVYSWWFGSMMDYCKMEIIFGYMKEMIIVRDESVMWYILVVWSVGIQINLVVFVVVDIVYEGFGSGDWCIDGFIVGVGYKF